MSNAEYDDFTSVEAQLAYLNGRNAGLEAGMLVLRNALQEQTYDLAHDYLTGLYNERGFEAAATRELVDNPGDTHAVIVLDLGNFKAINDNLGHDKGNQVLVGVASKLRSSDVAGAFGRTGGDEMQILLNLSSHADSGDSTDIERLALAVNRLHNIAEEIRLEEDGLDTLKPSFFISLGFQLIQPGETDSEKIPEILKAAIYSADIKALKDKDAKRQHHGQYRYHS